MKRIVSGLLAAVLLLCGTGVWERSVNPKEEVCGYVNRIPLSQDSDGGSYDTGGYRENTYLNSSGEAETMVGAYTTGFIPARYLDKVYLYGIDFAAGNAQNRIQFYDADKNLLGNMSTAATRVLDFHYDETRNLRSFVIKGWHFTDISQTAYIRICADYMDERSVITINETAGELEASPIPEKTAAFAEKVASHQSARSFTFAFLPDAHTGVYRDIHHISIHRAGQVVSEVACLDLVVHGGDLANGSIADTARDSAAQVKEYDKIMADYVSVPALWVIGNHDDAPYQETRDRLTQAQSFRLFGSKNAGAGAVFPDNCNYGYLDFEQERIRVMYLDTHDKRGWETIRTEKGSPDFLNVCNVGGEQLLWLVGTGLDFSGKENPGDWGIVVVSHAELDSRSGVYTEPVTKTGYHYNTQNVLQILMAYQQGGSGTIVHNGVCVSYDFSGPGARVHCAVSGHGHKFADRSVNGIRLIACPNISNGRERKSDDGVIYSKNIEGTSLCVITVDPETGRIYADSFGAGYDRVFGG